MSLALPFLQSASLHSEEDLAILEQLCIASLDVSNFEVAESVVTRLESRFEDSSRVMRLRGMVYEAAQNYTAATELYKNLLEKNPSNVFARKRLYAIKKSQNDNPVEALLSYLDENNADVQAWYELSDLYLGLADWQGAAFALEECVLLDPLSAHLHTLLGECYYTLSNSTSEAVLAKNFTVEPLILLARRHFSEALNLKRGDIRALMGLGEIKKHYGGTEDGFICNLGSLGISWGRALPSAFSNPILILASIFASPHRRSPRLESLRDRRHPPARQFSQRQPRRQAEVRSAHRRRAVSGCEAA